ncbi:SUR7/PalI family protein [Aspergillus glaucus CBS 516.65]|uniref:Uncharacterized protein n=1 Tax=Aspergillus glaucus CBS 516.65 TaxID=1160497 RepID=A0A1L9V605_ASPGL|nr:hypothetical protein ASPGLDRAFT_1045259 [Aspergillus glaucus CBS 516.65]OJJ79367.1 hypothetical protein ASPGLDRAFT_1045259 [Aspergillus glaucus CBS 516.65]
MLGRAALGFTGLFWMASGLLLMWFTFLGGTRNSNPLNRIYFLEAATSNIPGAPATSRWTLWNLCPVVDGKNDCGSNTPDFPFDPASHRNFGTDVNVPSRFIDNHNHYFITSRFIFPFMLIALFFGVLSFFTGFFAMCVRVIGHVSGVFAYIALTFQTIATAMMTAVFVQGRNAFSRNGQTAKVGPMAFGFMWASVVLLFFSALCYFWGGSLKRDDGGYSGREQRRRGFFSSQRSSSVRSNKETNV